MDNVGVIVETEDGAMRALTTNHGGICDWSLEEARERLKETLESANQLAEAIRLMEGMK